MDQASNDNWWTRNWKWFVPVGCLSMMLLFAAGIFLVMSFVFGLIKSSDPYGQAMLRARASHAVIEAFGSPIKEGFFTSGSINETGPSGTAQLAIPISGPKGSGTIYLEAQESAGLWTFSKLEVEVEKTGRRIDLLTEGGADADEASPDTPYKL
jgi:hypothetical protein